MGLEGLLVGLGEGLKSGVTSYKDAREQKLKEQQVQNQMDLLNQNQQMGLLEKGMEKSPEGLIKFNPMKKQQIETEQQGFDSNSDYSARRRQSTKALLDAVQPGLGMKLVNDQMSANEIEREAKEGLIGKYISSQGLLQRGLLANDRFNRGYDLKERSINLREGQDASHVADKFDNDQLIKQSQVQKQKLQQATHTLDTVETLTPQLLSEIQADIAAAIAQGGSNAASEQDKKEFNSYAIKMADLKQRITNKPQDIGSPEVKQYLRDVLSRLGESYELNMSNRAEQISGGRDYSYNPQAQKAMEGKLGQYVKKPASHKTDQPTHMELNGKVYELGSDGTYYEKK